jgi:hypothetical protein
MNDIMTTIFLSMQWSAGCREVPRRVKGLEVDITKLKSNGADYGLLEERLQLLTDGATHVGAGRIGLLLEVLRGLSGVMER